MPLTTTKVFVIFTLYRHFTVVNQKYQKARQTEAFNITVYRNKTHYFWEPKEPNRRPFVHKECVQSFNVCPNKLSLLLTNMAHMFYLFFHLSIETGRYGFFLCLYSVVTGQPLRGYRRYHTIKLHTDLFLKSVLLSKEERVDGGALSPDPVFVAPLVTCQSFGVT